MKIALAPMEGLVDASMRDAITSVGGIDWCVTEFIRVTNNLLPTRTYQRLAPEMNNKWLTPNDTPLHVQFLGSDPICLAENAARAAELGARQIDLNFGCPAKTVNRHRGGAALLTDPELLYQIVKTVRSAVPARIPVTAKMRLGFEDKSRMLDCAQALDTGGSAQIVIHARTKLEGYRPPAHWHYIAQVREVVKADVMANGEIWSVADYWQCRKESGCQDVMLGRGLMACPDLALQIRASLSQEAVPPLSWFALQPMIKRYYDQVQSHYHPTQAPGRLKQWLVYLRKTYPPAEEMYLKIKSLKVLDSDRLFDR